MWNKLGQLIIITAPSGAGKTTLIKKLLKDEKYCLSISYTTRSPRNYEVDGVDYHFTTDKDFLERKDNDFFAEWALVHNHYYGTSRQDSYDLIKTGKTVIFDVDYQGALNLQRTMPDALSIFILPPSLEILKKRLINRKTDSQDVIDLRIKNAQKEIYYAKHFDYLLINDNVDEAFNELKDIIKINKLNISKNSKELDPFIDNFLRGSWK
jgi:guanylate kinase